jgi:hypothetical protein
MKPIISVVMPAIRPNQWLDVYNSLAKSTKRSFELIIVSPYPLPKELADKRNVKHVKDFGSPVRASCIGAMLCEGKYVYANHADDAYFIEGAMDFNIDFLESMGNDIKNVVACKYSESENLTNVTRYHDDSYYKLVNAYPIDRKFVPADWWIFNVVIWHRAYFDKFGGFDCRFQVCPMAHGDLAVRAQKDGAIVKMSPYPLVYCNHMPGISGDHAPIHYAQTLQDDPAFREKFKDGIEDVPISLDVMSWKKAPSVWLNRFSLVA